jgi:hypothetical protein
MSRAIRLTLILCLASAASLTQAAAQDAPGVPTEADCPIGMRATIEKSEHPLAAQRLELTLTKWPSFAIVASRITVHGVANGANSAESPEITRSLDVDRIPEYARPASTRNVPSASTEQKATPAGQGLPAELIDVLGPLTNPVLVSGNGPRILKFDVGAPESRWYAWVSGFRAVNSVDLESVSYADGSRWHAPNGKTCRVFIRSSVR